MDKTINLTLRFKKDNPETAAFSKSFLQDLRECLARFKLDISVSESKAALSDHFTFIILSSGDLEDKNFLKEILKFADLQNTFLLTPDPINISDKSFPRHKFKIIRFWDEIKETGEVRTFRRDSSQNNALYWEKITDIATEIDERDAKSKGLKKGKVYLAQTDNAQSSDRDNLLRDLVELGYEVVPDRMLSTDYNECTENLNQLFNGCQLIIHPIPLVYSKYFPDRNVSIVEHQCILSAHYAADKQHNVKRIIWIPSDFDITDEDNQIFVEKIQRDQDQKTNTMVLKITMEDLKKIYRKILSGEDLQIFDEKLPNVYFVADSYDESLTGKIFHSQSGEEMKVNTNFKGITYNQHLKYLASSEFVIINYTADNEPWFMMKVNDIFKSKGIKTSKPFKKLILVKENKELNTSAFESRFSEVHVSSIRDLDLNFEEKK